MAREAFLAGVDNGGDSSPADTDYEEIQRSVAIAFESWWAGYLKRKARQVAPARQARMKR